jgi:hypothetical protein
MNYYIGTIPWSKLKESCLNKKLLAPGTLRTKYPIYGELNVPFAAGFDLRSPPLYLINKIQHPHLTDAVNSVEFQ